MIGPIFVKMWQYFWHIFQTDWAKTPYALNLMSYRIINKRFLSNDSPPRKRCLVSPISWQSRILIVFFSRLDMVRLICTRRYRSAPQKLITRAHGINNKVCARWRERCCLCVSVCWRARWKHKRFVNLKVVKLGR